MESTTLLYINNIINVFFENDILTIKLLGESFTDEIINKMFEVIELFYNICKKTSKKFYTIYDLVDCKLKFIPNYFYYITSISKFLQKHTEFYKIYLHSTLIITKTDNSLSLIVITVLLSDVATKIKSSPSISYASNVYSNTSPS